MDLKQAISLIRQGQKREAQAILMKLIQANPHDVPAWFWFVETLDTASDRIQCLEACLSANPGDLKIMEALDVLRGRQPASFHSAEPAPPPQACAEYETSLYEPHDAKTAPPQAAYRYREEEEKSTEQESNPNLPRIDIPANQNVLSFLRENSQYPMIAPYANVLGPYAPPALDDVVCYFQVRADSLPVDAKYLVYHCPALVHPATGVIFSFVKGEHRYYRLPQKTIQELAERKLLGDSHMNIRGLGKDWVSSLMITDRFINKAFTYYGSPSNQAAPFPLKLKEDLFLPKSGFARQMGAIYNGMLVLGFLVMIGLLGVLAAYFKLQGRGILP